MIKMKTIHQVPDNCLLLLKKAKITQDAQWGKNDKSVDSVTSSLFYNEGNLVTPAESF